MSLVVMGQGDIDSLSLCLRVFKYTEINGLMARWPFYNCIKDIKNEWNIKQDYSSQQNMLPNCAFPKDQEKKIYTKTNYVYDPKTLKVSHVIRRI